MSDIHEGYVCSKCAAHHVKLWRQYHGRAVNLGYGDLSEERCQEHRTRADKAEVELAGAKRRALRSDLDIIKENREAIARAGRAEAALAEVLDDRQVIIAQLADTEAQRDEARRLAVQLRDGSIATSWRTVLPWEAE